MVLRTRTNSRSTNNKTSGSNNKDLLLQTNKSSVHKYNRNKDLNNKQSSSSNRTDLQQGSNSAHRRRSSIKSTSSTDQQEIFSMLDPIESHRKSNHGQNKNKNKNQRRNKQTKKKKKIIYDKDDDDEDDDWSNSNSESENGTQYSSNPYLTESASLFSESTSSSFNYDDDNVIKAPTRKEKEQQQQQERSTKKSIKSSKGRKTAVQADDENNDDEQIMVTKSFSFSSRNNKPKSTKTKTKTKIIKKKEKNQPKKKNNKTSSSRRGQDVVVEQKEMSEDDDDDESIDNKKTSSSTKSLLQQKSLSLLCNRSRNNSTGSHDDHLKLIQDKFAAKAEPQPQPPSSNRSIQLTDILLTSSSSLYDNDNDDDTNKKKKNSKKKKKSSHDNNDDNVQGGVEIMTDEKKKEKKSKKSSHDDGDDVVSVIGMETDETDDSGIKKVKKEKKSKKKSKKEKKKSKKKKKKSKKSKKKKKEKKSKSEKKNNDSNIVSLNISGTKTTVLRKTLTSVPGSLLSLLFSSSSVSTSDSSESESERSSKEEGSKTVHNNSNNSITIPIIEKDQDNNYFIDQEFSLFHPMLNYLRNKANITGKYPNLDSPNNDDLGREGNTIQDFYRMVEYYGMTNEIFPTKVEVHSNNTGGSSLEEDTDSAVEFIGNNKEEVIAKEWTTFQLVDNGNHGRRVKNYEIKLGENVKRIQIGWKYTNNDIKFNSKRRNTGTGVGDINFTYALDLTRSVYLINGKSDPLPAPFDYQKGTIIRSENYGQIWYVDDEIVYSTSNDKWEAITSDRSNLEGMCPMISIKGGMEITCIELEE